MNTIGERIKSLRAEKGLSAQELGDIVGRSKSNISGYETGKYEPSAQTIISICKYFGVSADWLLTGTGVQKTEQCDGQPLSEVEADVVAMYRVLDSRGKEDLFDYLTMKYRKAIGESESAYSGYTGPEERIADDPPAGGNLTSGIA